MVFERYFLLLVYSMFTLAKQIALVRISFFSNLSRKYWCQKFDM